ncbi:hypothetical protein GIB67_036608 [Kingdonia uniflora]|uniref:non-specific serine/threonine protein kinase n=1 Tax=Kingdonia uniflora TaxID=39325 RepID=A0A7J7M0J8_9MAGN|nr:hypothetical protein GIB67_036608 [Kingdonia uniflora]
MGNCCCFLGAKVEIGSPGTSGNPSREVGLSSHNSSNAKTSQFFANKLGIEEVNSNGKILESPNLKEFTYLELKSATRNFRPDTVLGEGGFGRVFKGWIDEKNYGPSRPSSGMVVAVKRLDAESLQGVKEWQSEVNFLGRLSHPNLVRLLGYCCEDKEFLLVYEFVQRRSLENHLFRRGSAQPLSWDIRIKIAIGAARGLAFLHTSEKQVIYRDFKAANILLDGDYNAKISDFGLAKNGPLDGDSHVTTRVMGTYGYAAPEYVSTGHLYIKSDVYGFGVVLLEMLTGLKAIDTNRPAGQHNLMEWTKPLLSSRRKLTAIMDPKLEGVFSEKGALQAAQLVLRCLEADPRKRPSMQEVLEILEEVAAMKDRPKETRTGNNQPGRQKGHQRSPIHRQYGTGARAY